MSLEEWASLVATQVLNDCASDWTLGDQDKAAVADAIIDAIDSLWAIRPQ